MARRYFDRDILLSLSGKQAKQAYKQLYKIANNRYESIVQEGLYEFSTLPKIRKRTKWHKNYTKNNYVKLVSFLTSDYSTVSDIKNKRLKGAKVLDKLTKGKYSKDEAFRKDLFRFLTSQEYKLLKWQYPSEELIDFFKDAWDEALEFEDIVEIVEKSAKAWKEYRQNLKRKKL